jgi:hypothetical protein
MLLQAELQEEDQNINKYPVLFPYGMDYFKRWVPA